jgi:hypothetical protein
VALKHAANAVTLWQERSTAVTRLRMATEGAAKNNISQGLAKISQLNL